MKFSSTSYKTLVLLLSITLYLMSLSSPGYAKQTVASSESKKALTLGFFPVISTVALFKRFSPLRDYLSDSLGHPVELQTAKNFKTFVNRTDERAYDLVITAPHFTVRASDSDKYILRAAINKKVQQIFAVHKDSPIKSIEDLAGKNIATPPKQALMTMLGKQALVEKGVMGDKQPSFRYFKSHNAASQSVLAGESDCYVSASNLVYKSIKLGEPFRVLKGGIKVPNQGFLVASDLDPKLADRITQVLVDMNKTENGRKVLKQIGLPGYRTATAEEYEVNRPYMEKAAAIMFKK